MFVDQYNRPISPDDPRPLLHAAQDGQWLVGYCDRPSCSWRESSRPVGALKPSARFVRCACRRALKHFSLTNQPV
jgi:hypothetical protein